MKSFKKVLALLLVLVMVLSLAACGGNEEKEPEKTGNEGEEAPEKDGEEEGEEPEDGDGEVAEKPTITYLLLSSGSDKDEIEAAINDRLAELDAPYNVQLVIYGWDNYAEKLGLAARGTGDDFDLATVASWLGPYRTLVNEKTLMDITDIFEENAPELAKTLSDAQLKGASINGRLYAVPTVMGSVMARDHFLWNVEMVDELGLDWDDIEKMRTVESLEPALKAFKDKYPDRYPLDHKSEWAIRRVDNLIRGDEETGEAIIDNLFASDEMKHALEVIADYRDKGYIDPEAGAEHAQPQDTPDSWLVKRAEGEPDTEGLWSQGEGTPIRAFITEGDHWLGNPNVQGKMTAIYAHSEHPEEAIDFIEKIATDETIQNLLAWGIQDKHYELKDGKAYELPAKADGWGAWAAQFVSDAHRYPNQFQKTKDDPALKAEIEEFEADIKPAPDLGFTPSSELEDQFAQIKAIKDDHYDKLSRGKIDGYELFLDDLQAADIDGYLENLRAEYDEWKAQQ